MIDEPAMLVITPGEEEYDTESKGFSERLVSEILRELEKAGIPRAETSISTSSVGHGADAIALVITLGVAFLAGKKVEENLDAWVRLGQRLHRSIQKIRKKHGNIWLSQPLALILALKEVLALEPRAHELKLEALYTILIPNRSQSDEIRGEFIMNPDRYYVMVLSSDTGQAHVLCMKSFGELVFHHVLPVEDWMAFYGVGEGTAE